MILCDRSNFEAINKYSTIEILGNGVSTVIDHFIFPDRDYVVERGTPVQKPRYNPPSQTILVCILILNFNYFSKFLNVSLNLLLIILCKNYHLKKKEILMILLCLVINHFLILFARVNLRFYSLMKQLKIL